MTSNLLELQEMLRNLDMGSVQQVAQGQSGKAAQLLGMDEIKRRGEQMQEAKAEEAEQGMQQPPMVDQFLAASQQMMGQPAPMPPQMAQAMPPQMPQQQQGIGSMMPQASMQQPQMPPQMPMGQPPQQMPQQMMASGGAVMRARKEPTKFVKSPPKLNTSEKQGFGPLAVDVLDFLGREDNVKDSSLKSELAAMLMMANPLREKTSSIPVTPSGINRIIELYKSRGKVEPDYYDEESQTWVRDPNASDQLYATPPSSVEKLMGYSNGGRVGFAQGGRTNESMFEMFQNLNPEQRAIADKIIAQAEKLGMDPNLALAQAINESNLKPKAISEAGAGGVFQLMPDTAAELGVTDSYDIDQNILGGLTYYGQQLNDFGDVGTALAAYNAGPGAVRKHDGVPPFKETENYVRDVQAVRDMIAAHRSAGQGNAASASSPSRGMTLAELSQLKDRVPELPDPRTHTGTPPGRDAIPVYGNMAGEEGLYTKEGDGQPVGLHEGVVSRESQFAPVSREYSAIEFDPSTVFAAPGAPQTVPMTDELMEQIVATSGDPIRSVNEEGSPGGKRNLQPLFDFMMRSGLEYASGKNIGEAGIAGLGATADMGQQRRENARAAAADDLNADLTRAKISELKSRQGLTPAEAREKAIEELTDTREIALMSMPPAQMEALIQQTMQKYLPYGLMRQTAAPINTEQFDRTY
jgi:hypothetical protein